jgi:anaerobic dimethyl sulfoxide reductase subunit B (iron-sulfur subunit)
MRALDFGTREEMQRRYGEASGFPLPDPRLTEPNLRLTPHPAAPRSEADGEIANVEEVER